MIRPRDCRCGGAGEVHHARVGEDAVATWVECCDCGARGPEVEDAHVDRATAIAAWNAPGEAVPA